MTFPKTLLISIIGAIVVLLLLALVASGMSVRELLTDDGIVPRSACWKVAEHLLMPNYMSHAFIALSYFGIASRLLLIAYRRGRKMLTRESTIYGAFIGLCGLTHVSALCLFFYGIATIDTIVLATTAVISITACVLTYKVAPTIESAPDFEDIQKEKERYLQAYLTTMDFRHETSEKERVIHESAMRAFEMLERQATATAVLTGAIHTTNS